jgi:transposase
LRIATSPKRELKIIRLQEELSRQHKGSARRAKTKTTLGRTYAKVADRRRDWVEKTTTRLVRDFDVIVLENLNVTGMLKRPKAKPDPERPGAFLPNGARSKGGLNQSIARSCWGLFLRRLQDKAALCGVEVILVDPAYSSLQCRRCGHIDKANRESQAEFRCVARDHSNHADLNAAENILARGLALASARGHRACARVSRSKSTAARTSVPAA